MTSRPERYLVAALAFAVPAVWEGLGPGTVVMCALAGAAAYAAAGSRSRLPEAQARLRELTARWESRHRPAAARRPRRALIAPAHRDRDDPSEGAVSGYGW